MEIVDLSQDIYQGMKVYPGHLKTVVFQHATHEETSARFSGGFSFQTLGLMINDNGPTHVDSFSHLDPDPNALTIDQMPLELFYGSAICVDVRGCDPRTDIPVDLIESRLDESNLEVRPGDIVLFRTGTHETFAGTDQYLTDFPGLGAEASEWLASHSVKAFGVDSPTPDNPASHSYPCHMMSRHERITHYENLANLAAVSGKRFVFAGFPLKIIGGHGGPTRAVAILDTRDVS